ncbi:hypothetical protein IE53DRAFT_110103 [Violaceomyces palustris]|uniref:Uncharacterized protein n=1 Tax=Violaceomyces palustris TaxID=1673888 RepID=A0ACD0NWD2_9BASI|nr:hypothetical protein IE53DRAFT_110103 [Violaceomyces palustris]
MLRTHAASRRKAIQFHNTQPIPTTPNSKLQPALKRSSRLATSARLTSRSGTSPLALQSESVTPSTPEPCTTANLAVAGADRLQPTKSQSPSRQVDHDSIPSSSDASSLTSFNDASLGLDLDDDDDDGDMLSSASSLTLSPPPSPGPEPNKTASGRKSTSQYARGYTRRPASASPQPATTPVRASSEVSTRRIARLSNERSLASPSDATPSLRTSRRLRGFGTRDREESGTPSTSELHSSTREHKGYEGVNGVDDNQGRAVSPSKRLGQARGLVTRGRARASLGGRLEGRGKLEGSQESRALGASPRKRRRASEPAALPPSTPEQPLKKRRGRPPGTGSRQVAANAIRSGLLPASTARNEKTSALALDKNATRQGSSGGNSSTPAPPEKDPAAAEGSATPVRKGPRPSWKKKQNPSSCSRHS